MVTYGRPGPRRLAPARTRSSKERLVGAVRSSQRPQTQSRALIGPSGTPSDHLRFICAIFAGHGGRGAAGASALDRGPDGRLHEVPRRIFNVWCKEMGITRADNLSRACNNRGLAGWHFSNETADKHGAWQPLHKLVFLQTSDAVRQATGSTCVGGQSPRRALERSPHALFKLRQKAQCVWLVARWTAWVE